MSTHGSTVAHVILPERARLCDLNELVERTLFDMLPRFAEREMAVVAELDLFVPPVPLLAEPFCAALRRALAICVDGGGPGSYLRARIVLDRFHVTVGLQCLPRARVSRLERMRIRSARPQLWYEVGAAGDVDLLVGAQVLRALGGSLRVYRNSEGLKVAFALPAPRRPRSSHNSIGSTRQIITVRRPERRPTIIQDEHPSMPNPLAS